MTDISKTVKSLKHKWENFYAGRKYLKSIEIGDGKPLRGIKNSTISFQFPMSVICGVNGAGKSTFLALGVLAFHAKKKPIVQYRKTEYFDFNYFFRTSSSDLHPKGIKIIWEYTTGDTLSIKKGKDRWMRYIRNNRKSKRPIRGTEFVGISRIVPAFEKRNYGVYFSQKDLIETKENTEIPEYMTRIFGKRYSSFEEISYDNTLGTHTVNRYRNTHTSFNAGAGEECIASILGVLLSCPKGAFVAIEEIEIGLHPSLIKNLVDVLLEITLERHLQLMITSHSPEFLRVCPPESLILASKKRNGTVLHINSPNVEYAIHRIGGAAKLQVGILCEDKVASGIITKVLSTQARQLCQIIGYGGKDTLVEKAKTIRDASLCKNVVIIWDGDVGEKQLNKAKKESFEHMQLPGSGCPESYFLEKLETGKGRRFLKKEYLLEDDEIDQLIEELCAADPHDIPYLISQQIGTSSDDRITDDLASFVTQEFPNEFKFISKKVNKILRNSS